MKKCNNYSIRCIPVGIIYIGSSTNVSNRISKHISMLRKNIHPCEYMQKDFNLFGIDNFEFKIENEFFAINRRQEEMLLINKYSETNKIYNKYTYNKYRVELYKRKYNRSI